MTYIPKQRKREVKRKFVQFSSYITKYSYNIHSNEKNLNVEKKK